MLASGESTGVIGGSPTPVHLCFPTLSEVHKNFSLLKKDVAGVYLSTKMPVDFFFRRNEKV